MVTELGDEIAREVDRRILDALIAGVGNTITWNPSGYLAGDKDITLYRQAYEATIYNTLVDARAWIMENKPRTDRPDIEWWCVMAPSVWARFEKLEHFNIGVPIDSRAGIGQRYVGTINNIWKVYVTSEIDNNYILVGIKGDWKYSVGYWAPYQPMYVSPKYIINDNENCLGLRQLKPENSLNSGKSLLWEMYKTQRDNPEPSLGNKEGAETRQGAPFMGEGIVQTTNILNGDESRS